MEKPNNSVLIDYQNIVQRLEKRKGADTTTPATNFQQFINTAADLFVKKDTDYDSRFIRGLIALDARTIWTWEVDKKLDRLRTWLKRGELQVKDEGIRNSVDDLFIYTVQYVANVQAIVNNQQDPEEFLATVRKDRSVFFLQQAARLKAVEWVEFLVIKGRIKPEELLLQNLIRSYLGDQIRPEEWQLAIRKMLQK